ncbi:MAG: hypothetical protein ACLTR8_07300 [Oscillospiraceae bacterium]
MATRQIATEIVLGGEKEFNSAMTAINSNLKTLRTDMAATSAEFDGNADSIDALTAKQKILAETAAQNDAKVDALRQRYEHLKATLGEDAAATDKAKQALNQAIVAQQKAAKAAKENADALEAAQKAAREEAAAQEAANKSASAYTPVTQKAAGAAKTFGSSLKAFGSKVKESATEVKAAAHHVPVLGEALDVVGTAGKVAKVGLHAAGTAAKAVGTASATAAKGVASASAAMAKGFGYCRRWCGQGACRGHGCRRCHGYGRHHHHGFLREGVRRGSAGGQATRAKPSVNPRRSGWPTPKV